MSENIPWVIAAGLLVMLMQGGFALVTSGLCRAKNAGQIATMNLMIYPMSVLGFCFFGFAIMFSGVLHNPHVVASPWIVAESPKADFGNSEFQMSLFFFQAAAIAVAAAIPIGAMAERWRFRNFMLYACMAGALPFAIFGHWVWGGGWLGQLGKNFGLGHGFVDFAGSTVIHMAGGVVGLVGAALLGPRVGKFSRDGRPRPMPGHNLVYVVFGSLVLAFGWVALNLGPALFEGPNQLARITVNTMLASATGAVGAFLVVTPKFRKPDPSMLCNGLLAGLAAISGPCAFVNPVAAAIIGLVAGILVVYSVLLIEGKLNIDDPVGAISIHGVSGAWGTMALGLFANGAYGAGWNGIHTTAKDGVEYGVAGAFATLFGGPANDWAQLGAQAIGAIACLLFIGLFAYAWFKLSGLISPMRPRREEELAGLDLPEMGAECYPDFHLTDKNSSRTD